MVYQGKNYFKLSKRLKHTVQNRRNSHVYAILPLGVEVKEKSNRNFHSVWEKVSESLKFVIFINQLIRKIFEVRITANGVTS